jgi:hypothetical protein
MDDISGNLFHILESTRGVRQRMLD